MPKPQVPAKLTVDFSQVEDRREGGKAAHVPEGDYLLQVVGLELKHKKDDETSKYLNWRMQIVKPEKHKNAGSVWHITSLKPANLWSLRNLLEDMGIKIPKQVVELPLAQILAKKPIFGATLGDDEYEGKVKSKIQATFPKAQYEETGEEEEEEASTGAAAEDTSEDDEDEDLDEIGLDDL